MKTLIPLLLIPGLLFFFGCSGSNTTSEDTTLAGVENTTAKPNDCSYGIIHGALEAYKAFLITDSENPDDTTYVYLGTFESSSESNSVIAALDVANWTDVRNSIPYSSWKNMRYFYILDSEKIIYGSFNYQVVDGSHFYYLSEESGDILLEDICYENN